MRHLPTTQGPLLERDAALSELEAAVAAARAPVPRGSVVVVAGEPGIGKTRLLREWRARAAADVAWLWGTCEPLLAPAPYLPLVDMLAELPPGLGHAVRSGRGGMELLGGMLALLRDRAHPTVLVFDDVQWADGATLELLRYLARRVESARAVIALAHRSGIANEQPLQALLGALPLAGTRRLSLPPLSPEAVAQLARQAGRPTQAQSLFDATRGNPFFVSEWLATPAGTLPLAVRDAVLARATQLPEPARELLALVSVAPAGLEQAVIEAVLDAVGDALDACVQAQLLHHDGGFWRFRHDIARQACEATLSEERRTAMHAAVFDALDMLQASPARRVHHAERARLWPAVARLAPLAAHEAAQAGAHRQAAELLALAVAHAADEGVSGRAELLDRLADAQRECNRLADAVASREAALALLAAGGDDLAIGRHLRELARLHWQAGRLAEGRDAAQGALERLQAAGVAVELAMAHDVTAMLWVLDDPGAALHHGRLALAGLEDGADASARAHALVTLGFAELAQDGRAPGWRHLDEGLALALARDDAHAASRAWSNLASMSCLHRDWPRLDAVCEAGLAFAQARDLDFFDSLLQLRKAWGQLERGRFAAAREGLARVREMPDLAPLQDRQSRHLLALLDLREGRSPEVTAAYWRGQIDGSGRMPVDPLYAPQAVAAAEAAWLRGDTAALRQLLAEALPPAQRSGERWRWGQLLVWARRAAQEAGEPPPAVPPPVLAGMPEPCALELQGDAAAAALAWGRLGCRHAQALALVAGGDATAGLALLSEMGAQGCLRALRQRLVAGGRRELPRGPNRHARQDPFGLTARERQILALIEQGLSNRDIAERLSRSERTVEHHVSALLGKLGASTRADAARLAASSRGGS